MTSIRLSCRELLHHPSGMASFFVNGIIAFLIFISSAIVPLYFISYFDALRPELLVFEMIIVFIFTLEYLFRFWSAEKPQHYLFSFRGIIDLLSFLPFYFQLFFPLIGFGEILIFVAIIRVIKLCLLYTAERTATISDVNTTKHHGDFIALDDEKIITVIQRHPIIFFFSLLPVFLFTTFSILIISAFGLHIFSLTGAGICLLISILIFIKDWLDFHYDVIYVTDHRLVVQDKHLLGVERHSVPYHAVTNIHPNSAGLANILLGCGNITIETATTSHEKMVFECTPNPEQTMRKISHAQKISIHLRHHSQHKKNTENEKTPEIFSENFPPKAPLTFEEKIKKLKSHTKTGLRGIFSKAS